MTTLPPPPPPVTQKKTLLVHKGACRYLWPLNPPPPNAKVLATPLMVTGLNSWASQSYIKNSKGPKIDPWGTPHLTVSYFELTTLISKLLAIFT